MSLSSDSTIKNSEISVKKFSVHLNHDLYDFLKNRLQSSPPQPTNFQAVELLTSVLTPTTALVLSNIRDVALISNSIRFSVFANQN